MDKSNSDTIIKIVIIGESGVGKTNLLLRYTKNLFDNDVKPTIGMDFTSKELQLNNFNIKAQFWDTAGQEKYRSIAKSYYKLANGVLLVYDVTKKDSFDRIKTWLDEIQSNTDKKVQIFLIGNKNDLLESKTVSTEQGRALAKEHGMFFWETSAKTNDNNCVNEAFEAIIEECLKDIKEEIEAEEMAEFNNIRKNTKTLMVDAKSKEQTNNSGCC